MLHSANKGWPGREIDLGKCKQPPSTHRHGFPAPKGTMQYTAQVVDYGLHQYKVGTHQTNIQITRSLEKGNTSPSAVHFSIELLMAWGIHVLFSDYDLWCVERARSRTCTKKITKHCVLMVFISTTIALYPDSHCNQ